MLGMVAGGSLASGGRDERGGILSPQDKEPDQADGTFGELSGVIPAGWRAGFFDDSGGKNGSVENALKNHSLPVVARLGVGRD